MGKAKDGAAEANALGGGQEAHRGGAESTVGEVEAGGLRDCRYGIRLITLGVDWI